MDFCCHLNNCVEDVFMCIQGKHEIRKLNVQLRNVDFFIASMERINYYVAYIKACECCFQIDLKKQKNRHVSQV